MPTHPTPSHSPPSPLSPMTPPSVRIEPPVVGLRLKDLKRHTIIKRNLKRGGRGREGRKERKGKERKGKERKGKGRGGKRRDEEEGEEGGRGEIKRIREKKGGGREEKGGGLRKYRGSSTSFLNERRAWSSNVRKALIWEDSEINKGKKRKREGKKEKEREKKRKKVGDGEEEKGGDLLAVQKDMLDGSKFRKGSLQQVFVDKGFVVFDAHIHFAL